MTIMAFDEFSQILIESGDLDPDYIFMFRVFEKLKMEPKTKERWVVLKSAIYDSTSELEVLLENAELETIKYGNERRKQKRSAKKNIESLQEFVDSIGGFSGLPKKAEAAGQALQTVFGIGPWASWKVLDLCETVLGVPIDFSSIDFRKAYEFPLRGLLMINELPEKAEILNNNDVYKICMDRAKKLLVRTSELKSRPQLKRKINLQEIETCLCKYHSYIHGHYKPSQDLNHIKARLMSSSYRSVRDLEDCLP